MQFSGCNNDWTIFHLRFVWLIESSQDKDRLIFILFEACADGILKCIFRLVFEVIHIVYPDHYVTKMTSKSCTTQAPKSQASPFTLTRIKCNCTALPGHSDQKICFAEKKVYKTPHYSRQPECGALFPHFVVCLSSAGGFLLLCGRSTAIMILKNLTDLHHCM